VIDALLIILKAAFTSPGKHIPYKGIINDLWGNGPFGCELCRFACAQSASVTRVVSNLTQINWIDRGEEL
jgi:hypothetical protein